MDLYTSPSPRTDSVFYLKINKESDDALSCFFHWVRICEALGASYFVLCDNDSLRERLLNSRISAVYKDSFRFLPSYRDKLSTICGNILDNSQRHTGYALLTPFLHAKETGIGGHWNIDADDTLMFAHPQICAEILLKAEKYAVQKQIDCFSFDMWHSQLHHFDIPHWSFGVTYASMTVDYVAIIESGKRIADKIGYYPMHLNIDCYFSFLQNQGLLQCESFYCEGLWFEHYGFAISCHEDGRIRYIRGNEWNSAKVKVDYEGVAIAEDVVRLDIGLTKAHSSFKTKAGIIRRKHDIYNYVFPFDEVSMNSKIILYGAGSVGRQFLSQILSLGYCECLFIADKDYKEIVSISNIDVKSPKAIEGSEYDRVVIASNDYQDAIYGTLLGLHIPEEKIVKKVRTF